MLEDCLAALEQESLVTRIVVVNNGSTDGTAALLSRLEGKFSKIFVMNLDENTGGAGGFHFGIKQAMQLDENWIWCMDDDVEATRGCLENLLKYSTISKCIHPLVRYEDGTEHEWEHIFDPVTTKQIGLKNQSFKSGKDWCSMNVACFEGMLIHRDVVKEIGLPDREFFIYGDDGHYGFLASFVTNVIYVKSGVLLKKIKPPERGSAFRLYYDIRNRFFLKRKLAKYTCKRRFDRYQFCFFIMGHSLEMLRTNFSIQGLIAIARAWRHGVKGISGKL